VAQDSGTRLDAFATAEESRDVIEDTAVMIAVQSTEQGGSPCGGTTVSSQGTQHRWNCAADYLRDIFFTQTQGLAHLTDAITLELLHDQIHHSCH
jgi:hypothetical protein